MTIKLIDIGVNLSDKAFDSDRDTVIENAIVSGIETMIITGTDLLSSQRAIQLCESHKHPLYCTAGFHPHHAKDCADSDLDTIKKLITKHDCVRAIGECGLDFNRNFSPQEQQIKVFEAHLALASIIPYPLFMHERDATDTFISIFSNFQSSIHKGVVHCFTGDKQALKQYLDMGLYIGITGWVCDERRGKELLELLQFIPLDRLMIETDAPYLIPRDLKPKPKSRRNEPKYLMHIATTIAKQINSSVESLAKHSYENSQKFFQLI